VDERFKVTELTGYTIGPERPRRTVTTFYVLDRAYCHRVIATFDRGPLIERGIRAYALAEKLNAGLETELPAPSAPRKQWTRQSEPEPFKLRAAGGEQEAKQLIAEAALRRWRRKNGRCTGCGAPRDLETRGCFICYARHRVRRQNA